VIGADGFIGSELVKVLVASGRQVFGLAGSLEAAERVRRAGATAIMGDLARSGQWQDEAAADWVFHLPPHPFDGARVSRQRAAFIARARVSMDEHLLDAVAAGATRRIVACRVPAAATRLLAGSVLADHLQADAVFSNIRLRGIGFLFNYPTLEHGLRQVLGALDEERT
jgi:NAD dependent epimerase/dehydratase family enzyme